MFYFTNKLVKNQKINLPIFKEKNIEVYLKREDLINPLISGNKFRKLKYNISEFYRLRKKNIITFGGPYSNHLLACAQIGHINKIETVGIVRGNELEKKTLNYNLKLCQNLGMKLHFISRDEYKKRNKKSYQQNILKKHIESYLIPEGGTNDRGVMGCEEILCKSDEIFDVICCPVGSGGTISGIINKSKKKQTVIGFSALKSSRVENVISRYVSKENWHIFDDDLFGGYSKIDKKLVNFINEIFRETKILFDPIYNSKMLYKIISLINNSKWPYGQKILLINTGGLHSIDGINKKLINKGCATINQ